MKKHSHNSSIHDYGHDRTVHSLGRSGSVRSKQRQLTLNIISFALCVILLALAVWLAWPLVFGQSPQGTAESSAPTTVAPTESSVETTAAPTTIATLSAADRQARLADAGAQVTALLSAQSSGRFAVYYQNLVSGDVWQINADQPFVAASSIKLGINTLLYTKLASGEISPTEMLAYDNRNYPTGDYESGTGSIQSQPNGTQYSVRDTSGLSIRISDNCGTNMVIRRLGGIDTVNVYLNSISAVVDYRKSVSYTNYAGSSQSGRHRTSATDLGLHAVNLYTLWQADPQAYQPLIDDLCATEFDFGIQKGIPADILVAHKIGTNGTYSAENDVGIVFGEEPFVLCVMTEMGSAYSAHQLQADIAEIFYNTMEAPIG